MSRLTRAIAWWQNPRARSREELLVWGLVHFVALCVAYRTIWLAIKPVVRHPPVAVVPPDAPGERFGVKEEIRRKVFAELAAAEPGHRETGHTSFPTEIWSAEDHRASFERHLAASLSTRFGLSLTQVYLIFDEGIRNHWPGPDGKPLSPQTVPLKPRRTY
jgi:hypothetical protein